MEQGTNGYVKWRDLDERLRKEATELNQRLDRAHKYANERLDTIDADIMSLGTELRETRDKEVAAGIKRWESLGAKLDAAVERETDKVHVALGRLDTRVDAAESTLDQMRGARNLIYFLIGSNLMVVVGLIIAVLIAISG